MKPPQPQPGQVVRAVLEQHGLRSSNATVITTEILQELRARGWHFLSDPKEDRQYRVRGAPQFEQEEFSLGVQLDERVLSNVQTLPLDIIRSWSDVDGLVKHTKRKLAHELLHAVGRELGLET